jgi:hypothetical protein
VLVTTPSVAVIPNCCSQPLQRRRPEIATVSRAVLPTTGLKITLQRKDQEGFSSPYESFSVESFKDKLYLKLSFPYKSDVIFRSTHQSNYTLFSLLFCGEGPRSRYYGRTAALRLLVQPCDEDEEKDDKFFIFPSNVTPVE